MSPPGSDPDRRREQLSSALQSTRWNDVRWVAETESTNADLGALARGGAARPVVLVADHQTAGRGRMARRWQSPAGANILLSVLVPRAGSPDAWGRVSAAAAVAAVDACRAAGVDVAIKWPNDLHCDGLKLSGLLAEAVTAANAVVVGIGINVAWPSAPDLELGATSLAAAGSPTDRLALLADLLLGLDRRLSELDDDPSSVMAAYRERCSTLGQLVRVELVTGSTIEGIAAALDPVGALVVETDRGPEVVTVGDVHHLRPAEGNELG